MNQTYHYNADGKSVGPVTVDDLIDLLHEEKISPSTKIIPSEKFKEEKTTEWKPLENHEGEFLNYIKKNYEFPKKPEKEQTKEEPKMTEMEIAILRNQKNMMKPPATETKEYKYSEKHKRYITTDESMEYDFIKKEWKPIIVISKESIANQMSIYDVKPEKKTKKRRIEEVSNNKINLPEAKKQKVEETSKESESITCVYVSGLPKDITFQEMESFFGKCGLIRVSNDEDRIPQIKLYKDDKGVPKGDGIVNYLQSPSVTLALQILDETEIRRGYKVKIERAKFQSSIEGGKKKKKKRVNKKGFQFKKLKWAMNDDDLDWSLRSVIIKNMFHPNDFRDDPLFGIDLKKDVKEECSNLGVVERVRLFENNPEGVVHVIFKYQHSAQQCVNLMNGRFFNKRKLECYFYDGKDYFIKESKEEEFKRLEELVIHQAKKD